MKYHTEIEGTTYEIEIDDDGSITIDGEPVNADLLQVGPLGLYSLLIDNNSTELVVEEDRFGYRVMLGGRTFDVKVMDERQLRLSGRHAGFTAATGELAIRAPIPGLVVRVLVHEGEELQASQPVMLLEAMKMENELRAPRAGTVKEIKIKAGESVDQGEELIIIV